MKQVEYSIGCLGTCGMAYLIIRGLTASAFWAERGPFTKIAIVLLALLAALVAFAIVFHASIAAFLMGRSALNAIVSTVRSAKDRRS